ncbi:MAG: spermidine/putrescine ABC transporter permease PotB [Desulfobacteraceae bacterium]|jgi:spermidine/putrescine transport system permease protein|nr:MAG: spermidine/putrescine ABC transporter permease PotB [Desulfobacteraceae bacterium]
MTEKSLFKTATIGLTGAWLGFFVLIPNVMILATSFLQRDEAAFVRLDFTLENYRRILDPVYLQVFGHSAAMALVATMVCLALGYPFAYALARTRPGLRHLLLLLVIIPFWTNSLIRTYAIRSLLATQGVLNKLLLFTGIIDEPLRLLYTGTAVTIGLVYILFPFMVLPLFAVIEKLDTRLLEASADLGAGRFQTFVRVIIPLTMPGIIAGGLLVFLPALGMFYVSDLLGGAKDLLIGNFIKNQFLDARDWPFGAAASVTMTLIMALMLIAYFFSIRKIGKKEIR